MGVLATLRLDTGSGIVDIPVFDLSDLDNDYLRIETPSGTGGIRLMDPGLASRPYLRVYTASGIKAVDSSLVIDDFNNDLDGWDSTSTNFQRTTTPVKEGSHAMENASDTNPSSDANFAIPPGNLNYYPSPGDIIRYFTRIDQSDGSSTFNFGCSNNDGGNQYEVFVNLNRNGQTTPSTFALSKDDGSGYNELAGEALTLSTDTWYEVEIQWDVNGNGNIVCKLFQGGSNLSTISATDTSYRDSGIGVRYNSAFVQWDYMRITNP